MFPYLTFSAAHLSVALCTEHLQPGVKLKPTVRRVLLTFAAVCSPVHPPQVMSAGRSADGREVQIPLQQVAPSLVPPLSAAPVITTPSHRPANPWSPSEPTTQQGKPPQHLNKPSFGHVWDVQITDDRCPLSLLLSCSCRFPASSRRIQRSICRNSRSQILL